MSLLHLFLLLLCSAAAEGRGIVPVEPPPTADAAATSARLLELSRRLSGAGPFGDEQRRDAGLALGYMRLLQRQLAGLTLDEDSAEARAQLAEMIAGAERSMNSYEDRGGASLRPFLSQMAAAAGNQGRALAPPSREEAASPPPTAAAAAEPPPGGRARPDGRPPLPPPDETPVGRFLGEHPQAAGPRPQVGKVLGDDFGRDALRRAAGDAAGLRRDPGDAGALGPGRQAEKGGGRPGAAPAPSAADAALAARLRAEREMPRMRLALRQAGLTGTADSALLASPEQLRRVFEQVLPGIPENAADPEFDRLLTLEDYDELLARFRAAPDAEAFKDVELRERDLEWARSCSAADSASCNKLAVARGAFYKAGKPVSAALLRDMLASLRGTATAQAPAARSKAQDAAPAPQSMTLVAAQAKRKLGMELSGLEAEELGRHLERERLRRKRAWVGALAPALLEELEESGRDVSSLRRLHEEGRTDEFVAAVSAAGLLGSDEAEPEGEAAALFAAARLGHSRWLEAVDAPDGWLVPVDDAGLAELARAHRLPPGARARRVRYGRSSFEKTYAALSPESAARHGVELLSPDGRDAAFVSDDGELTRARVGRDGTRTEFRSDGDRRLYTTVRTRDGREREREEGELRNGFFVPDLTVTELEGGKSLRRLFWEGDWYESELAVSEAGRVVQRLQAFNPRFDYSRLPYGPRHKRALHGLDDPRRLAALQRLPPLSAARTAVPMPDGRPGNELYWDGTALILTDARVADTFRITPPAADGRFSVQHADGRGEAMFFRRFEKRGDGAWVEWERDLRERGESKFYKPFRRVWTAGEGGMLRPGGREALEEPADAPKEAGRWGYGFFAALKENPAYGFLHATVGQPLGFAGRYLIRGSAGHVSTLGGLLAQGLPGADGEFVTVRGRIEAGLASTYGDPSPERLRAVVDGALGLVVSPKHREAVRESLMEDALRALFAQTPGDDWGRFIEEFRGRYPDREAAYAALAPHMARAGSVDGFLAELKKGGGAAKYGAYGVELLDFVGQMAAGAALLKPVHTLGALAGRTEAGLRVGRFLNPKWYDRLEQAAVRSAARMTGAKPLEAAAKAEAKVLNAEQAANRAAESTAKLIGAPAHVAMQAPSVVDLIGRALDFGAEPDEAKAAEFVKELAGNRAMVLAARASQRREIQRQRDRLAWKRVEEAVSRAEAEREAEKVGSTPEELWNRMLQAESAGTPLRPRGAAPASPGASAAPPPRTVFVDTTLLIDAQRGRPEALAALAAMRAAGERAVATPQVLVELSRGADAKAFIDGLVAQGLVTPLDIRVPPERRSIQNRLTEILFKQGTVGAGAGKEGHRGGDAELLGRAMAEAGPDGRAVVYSSDMDMLRRLHHNRPAIRAALEKAGLGDYALPEILDPRAPEAGGAEAALRERLRQEGIAPIVSEEVLRASRERAALEGGGERVVLTDEMLRIARELTLREAEARRRGERWVLGDEFEAGPFPGRAGPRLRRTGDARIDGLLDRVEEAMGPQYNDAGVREPVFQVRRRIVKLRESVEVVELVSGVRFEARDLDVMRKAGLTPKVLDAMPEVSSIRKTFDDDFVEVRFADGRKGLFLSTGERIRGTLSARGFSAEESVRGVKRSEEVAQFYGGDEVMLMFDDPALARFLADARKRADAKAPEGPQAAGEAVRLYIMERMPFRNEGSVGKNLEGGGGLVKPVGLLDSAGVCRHQNVLAALVLEDMARAGVLRGRARYQTGPGHAWAEFWPEGEYAPVIVDIAQKYAGPAVSGYEAVLPSGLARLLPGAKGAAKPRLKRYYAGDDKEGNPRLFSYLDPSAPPTTTE